MFDWIAELFIWITTLPARALGLVLEQVVNVLDSLSPLANTPSSLWSSLPFETVQLLSLCGFGGFISIVGAAYVVKVLLRLIPFIRLG